MITLLMLSFIITSCINIYYDVYINSDGSGKIEIVYDFEQVMKMMESMPEEERQELILEEICESFELDLMLSEEVNLERTKKIDCIVEEHKVKIYAELPDDMLFPVQTKTDGTYELYLTPEDELYELIAFMFIGNMEDDEFNATLESTLHFEGEVLETNIGQKQGNKILLTLDGEQEITNIKIIARTKNAIKKNIINAQKIIIPALIIVIILVITIILLKKRKKEPKQKTQETPDTKNEQEIKEEIKTEITPNIQILIDWIREHEKQHTEETLRETLLKSQDFTEQEIDFAFKNK